MDAALGSTSAFPVFVMDAFAPGHPHWLYVIGIELFVLHMVIIYQVRQSLCALPSKQIEDKANMSKLQPKPYLYRITYMSHLLYAREPPSVTASPVLALVHHQVNTCKYPERNGLLQGNTQHFFCEVEMVLKRKLGNAQFCIRSSACKSLIFQS